MSTIIEELNTAVKELPVLYQPIFGYEVIGRQPDRICVDRLPDITKIYDALNKELKRPLHVLDLGCNLGFFSFHAAKRGGVVTGVDVDQKNIRICKILARENPDCQVKFIESKLEEFIPKIKKGEYDLVFCFSVLHWCTLAEGFPFIQKLLEDLSKKIPTGLFELAQRKEFPKNNLPASYRDFLQGYSFIRVMSYNVWGHYRNFRRPFIFVSNNYAHFDEFGLLKIDICDSHPLNPKNLFYYHCGDKFIKMRCIGNQTDFERTQREINFLSKLGGQNGLPKLYTAFGENDEAGLRFFIVREKIIGISLSQKLKEDKNLNRWEIIKQILQWQIFFAKRGYYSSDLHTGNFIYSEDGKLYPIDYELMINEPVSIRWPYNLKLEFFNLMNVIFEPDNVNYKERLFEHTNGKMLSAFRKHVSEYQYCQISALKDSEDFFEQLYEILFPSEEKKELPTMAELEIVAIGKYLDELGIYVQADRYKLNELTNIIMNQQKRIEQLEKIIKERLQ